MPLHSPRLAPLRRRLPDLPTLRDYLHLQKPTLDRRAARLAKAADLWDLRRIAKRRTPTGPFDYVDGAAEREISLGRARQVYDELAFRPQVLRDVGSVTPQTTVAGAASAMPLVIAPTGFTRMMHSEGETAGVRAAHAAGIPFTLSTMGTATIEEVAEAGPDGRRWFQLYLAGQDRGIAEDLVARAHAAGYDTLMVTVDTATGGLRYRDHRNGMTIPPQLMARTLVDASYRPRWWFDFLTTEPLRFATLSSSAGDSMDVIMKTFDPTLSELLTDTPPEGTHHVSSRLSSAPSPSSRRQRHDTADRSTGARRRARLGAGHPHDRGPRHSDLGARRPRPACRDSARAPRRGATMPPTPSSTSARAETTPNPAIAPSPTR